MACRRRMLFFTWSQILNKSNCKQTKLIPLNTRLQVMLFPLLSILGEQRRLVLRPDQWLYTNTEVKGFLIRRHLILGTPFTPPPPQPHATTCPSLHSYLSTSPSPSPLPLLPFFTSWSNRLIISESFIVPLK